MNKMRGITLFELLIVMAIMTILAATGVPAFRQMVASNRLTTNANNLVAAFNSARNEAITRARPINVTAATTGWTNGWSVKDGAATLTDWKVLSGNVDIVAEDDSGTSLTTFQYNAQGRLNTSGTMKLCLSNYGYVGRLVTVSAVGRVSVTTVNTCP